MKAFLIELGIISLLVAAIIGLLALFSNKMKDRLSASCRYIIWLVVIARLAIPYGGVLVPSLINIPVDNTQIEEKAPLDVDPENEGYVESVQNQNSSGNIDANVNNNVHSGTVDNTENSPSAPQFTPEKEPVYNGSLNPEPENKEFEFNADMIAPILFAVWAAGAVIFFTVNVIRYNGIKETMRRNLTEADGRVAEIYEELCREMEIKKAPALYSSPLAQSPMLCGYFKKKIIVPRLSVSEGSLRAVLTHELTHHKRGDVWAKLLALLANSIHWFNPAVYMAVERFNSEMELSCDEKTLLGKDDEARVEYGKTMLDIVSRCRGGEAVLTTKFNPKKNASGERIKNILDTRKKGKGIIIIAATVLTCVIVGVIIGCEVVKADEETDFDDILSANDKYNVVLAGSKGDRFILSGKEGKEPSEYGEKVPLKLWITSFDEGVYFEGYYANAYIESRTQYENLDLTGDGVADHILKMPTMGGSEGIHGEEVHVFDGTTFGEIPVSDALSYLKEKVELSGDERAYHVKYDDKDILFRKDYFVSKGRLDKPYIAEDFYNFSFTDDAKGLTCSYLIPVAENKMETLGYLKVIYEYSKKDKAFVCSDVYIIGPEMCESNSENWEMTAHNASVTIMGHATLNYTGSEGSLKIYEYGDFREEDAKEGFSITQIDTYNPEKLPKLFVSGDEKYAAILYSVARYAIDDTKEQRVAIVDLDNGKVICIIDPNEKTILESHGLSVDTIEPYTYAATEEDPGYEIRLEVVLTAADSFEIKTVLATDDKRIALAGSYLFNGSEESLSDYIEGYAVISDPLNGEGPQGLKGIDSLTGVGDDVKRAAKALLARDTATLEELTGCPSGVLRAYKDFKFTSYSYRATDDGYIEIDLDIGHSSLDTVPAGKYRITVGYGLWGVDISGFTGTKNNLQGEGASFMYAWISIMGDPVIPESVADKELYHRYLVDFMFQQMGEATPEEYRKMAKKMFGVDSLMIPEGFINEAGNVYVGGHGGAVRSFEIVSEEVSGDTVIVTVQTYADHMKTIKSRLIKNTFKKVDGVLSVLTSEVIEDNGYEEQGYAL